MTRVLLLASLLAASLGLSAAAQNGQLATPIKDPNDDKPWPEAAALERAKQAAEQRPLFASDEPLSFTLIADFGQVQGDRNPDGTRLYPATVVLAQGTAEERTIEAQIRTRGHSRLKPDTCFFAPLRLVFPSNPVGTVFEGQKRLKLGVHCKDLGDYPEYVLREYPVYRMFNLLTANSFRARIADVRYVDSKNNKTFTRGGLFIEDDDDVARRMGGRISDSVGKYARTYDAGMMALTTVFGYMIGNTDVSVRTLHNVRTVLMPDGRRIPIPYDFDYSGVVDAAYAVPNPLLDQGSVHQRLYLGPCLSRPMLTRTVSQFTDAHATLLGVYDTVPMLKPQYRVKAKAYLEGFFERVSTPAGVKRAFVDGCGTQPFM
jgi:hypothetical protein